MVFPVNSQQMQHLVENKKLQYSLLAVGAIIIAAGIALQCVPYSTASLAGKVILPLSTIPLSFGIMLIIFRKCAGDPKQDTTRSAPDNPFATVGRGRRLGSKPTFRET